MTKDYYKILELDKTSTPEQIKKQYKLLAMKHHPDKGGDSDKFKDVAEAYEVLSDSNKRNQYDNPQSGFNFNQSFINPDEIFRSFFCGGHPGLGAMHSSHTPFVNINVRHSGMGSRIANVYSRSTNTVIRGHVKIEKTTEIANGVKTESTKETNLVTGEVTESKRLTS